MLDKNTPEFVVWKLEQLINFGLDGEKISRNELKKHLNTLNIDPFKKNFLRSILKDAQTN